MAKRKTTAKADDDGVAMKVPSQGKFRSLMKQIKAAEADKNESTGRIGSLIANAVERDHLDKKALAILRTLERASPQRGALTWAHLQRYVEIYGLNELWSRQGEMFDEGDEDYAPQAGAALQETEAAGETAH
jgi:hypothetical protein